jgi:hypothetical protein
MKRFILLMFSVLSLTFGAQAQTAPIYVNFGSVSDSPQIDALAFANYGSFSASSSLPYDFQSTLYFTNRGSMAAFPGFRFGAASSSQPPFRPAIYFENDVGGTVEALDQAGQLSAAGSGGAFGNTTLGNYTDEIVTPSYTLVSADTIINKGYLLAGAAGLLQLTGNNVDLSRSGVGIQRIEATSTHYETPVSFFPDPGILDNYWGLTNQVMRVAPLLSISPPKTNAHSAPGFLATNGPLAGGPSSFSLSIIVSNTNSTYGVFTNVGGMDPATSKPTNITRQAVFVQVSDTNFYSTVKWAGALSPASLYKTPVVQIVMGDTNTLTGDPAPATLYFEDTLASNPNLITLTNLAAYPPTSRPAPFVLARTALPSWLSAAAGKGTLTNTFFFNQADTNSIPVVTNTYAAYSAQIDDLASPIPNAPGADVTDAPGRVEITATNLNLSQTRLRGTGYISINTPNLTGSTNVNVDGENVGYNLATPGGTLRVQHIAKDKVVRMNGELDIWSAIFTNYIGIPATVAVPDASGTGTTNVMTNVLCEVDYQMVVIDATKLVNTKQVQTRDFSVHGDSVILSDPITLNRSLLVDTPNFTLDSTLDLAGINDFGSTNAPRLQSFTVTTNGLFLVQNVGNFGQDTTSGYTGFTNNGFIGASGLLIMSQSFFTSGMLTSVVEGISIEASTAQFQNAVTYAAADLTVSANSVIFTGSSNAAGGALILNATQNLSDAGSGGAANDFISNDGIQLPVKPTTGDLLGSTIQSIAPRFAEVENVWAGENRGASASGFQNNVAIGHLLLTGDRDVLHHFTGASGNNGLYVNFLELGGAVSNAFVAGDITTALQVDPSLTIYFANSNVPADQLQQQSGGRLVQVAGTGLGFSPGTSTSGGSGANGQGGATGSGSGSTSTGGSNSTGSTSGDGGGIPLRLTGTIAVNQTSIVLSWPAQPNINYQVEYTSSLADPNWQVLSPYVNSGNTAQTATVQDQLAGDHSQRFYRVRTR